jgi:hypothetical protein
MFKCFFIIYIFLTHVFVHVLETSIYGRWCQSPITRVPGAPASDIELGLIGRAIEPAQHHWTRHVDSALKDGAYLITVRQVARLGTSLSMEWLQCEARAKAMIAIVSLYYPNNYHPLATSPARSVPTCYCTLTIGLTRHSETMSGYDIMKVAPVKTDETWYNMWACSLWATTPRQEEGFLSAPLEW